MDDRRVLVRVPGESITQGQRIKHRGEVDYHKAWNQHVKFREGLEWLGYTIDLILPPAETYPDSVFVEDPAIILGNTYITTHLSGKNRSGEELLLKLALARFFPVIRQISSPGYIEGGDVLITKDIIYVGISSRTDDFGFGQLAAYAHSLGYAIKRVPLGTERLHLKGECSYHPDHDLVLASDRLAHYFMNARHHVLAIPELGDFERFGANCISRRNKFLVHKGCESALRILHDEGFETREVDLSEYDKIDGAMTCLWKQF